MVCYFKIFRLTIVIEMKMESHRVESYFPSVGCRIGIRPSLFETRKVDDEN